MKSFHHLLHFLPALLSFTPSLALPEPLTSAPRCKAVPGSANWPSAATWASLNKSLGGRLLAPKPPALVCDPHLQATYNKSACASVGADWFSETFHSDDPVSAHFPNWQADACLPTAVYNATTGCDVTPFPHYVVNASAAEHVVQAVKFAGRTGVRLSVKGTGHDFLGRSAAPGLMIWTHNIKGIDVVPSFKPESCGNCSGTPAITIAAGQVWGDVYAEGKKHSVIPVGGADGTVGLGGYLLGGGHSPISTKFGLAADNALEMEVVTPCGAIVTANDYQNQDLFWALKGGGGSTFGVLLSATVRTYPTFPIVTFFLLFSSTKTEAAKNNNANFYAALGHFHTQLPPLSDSNVTGYWSFGPTSALSGTGVSTTNPEALLKGPQTFAFQGWILNGTQTALQRLLEPISAALNKTTGITSTLTIQPSQDIYKVVGAGEGGGGSSSGGSGGSIPAAGYNLVIGSRLWDKKALSNATSIASTYRAIQPTVASGLFVSGPGVRNPALTGSASFTPAWRSTYLHVSSGVEWPYDNSTAAAAAKTRNTNVVAGALRSHAPDMGCYLNEADVMEPDFQNAFWGSNYQRLVGIKKKYDPQSVFWCESCVGSEGWKVQGNGEVCRVG